MDLCEELSFLKPLSQMRSENLKYSGTWEYSNVIEVNII